MAEPSIEDLKRQYRRLSLAEEDLQEARAFALAILELDLHSRPKEPLDTELRALSLAAVVSYGRAFVKTESSEESPATEFVPKSVRRCLSAEEKDLHQKLLRLRHEELAHSDLRRLGLQIELVDGGDISMFWVTRVPLSKREVQRLKGMTEKLIDELLRRFEILRSKLPPRLEI